MTSGKKKRNCEKMSYEKDIENEELKILRTFSQSQNESIQFEEKDEYILLSKYLPRR